MLNRNLSLFALTSLVAFAMICLVAIPAQAHFYIAPQHHFGYSEAGVIPSNGGKLTARIVTLCTPNGDEPWCFPSDISVSTWVEITTDNCSQNLVLYGSRAELVFTVDTGDESFVNASLGTAAGLAAFIEFRRNVFTGEIIPGSLQLGNNFPGCINLYAHTGGE